MSFQQGLSGLNASSKNLEVIGNNIANANTYGTKVARAEFSDMYASALGGGTGSVGIGTRLANVAQQFTQGNISTTDNAMDVAIKGNGFFQLTDGQNPIVYSRNGQFKVDREGFVVNNSGLKLMGYAADNKGVIQPGQAVPLQLPTSGVDPAATTAVTLEMNLDSRKAITAPAASPLIDFNDATTYNNATSLTVYDAKGQEVPVTYYFQKVSTDTWNVFATANGVAISADPLDPQPLTTITFEPDGSAPTAPAAPVPFDILLPNNAAPADTLSLTLDLSTATQFGSAFGVTDQRQDGFSAGDLTSIMVESNGVVMARYSNGQSRPAGQVELATFRNTQGLQPMGDNAWGRTYARATPSPACPKLQAWACCNPARWKKATST
jgi:flagellar hook protein FlgE